MTGTGRTRYGHAHLFGTVRLSTVEVEALARAAMREAANQAIKPTRPGTTDRTHLPVRRVCVVATYPWEMSTTLTACAVHVWAVMCPGSDDPRRGEWVRQQLLHARGVQHTRDGTQLPG